MNRRDYQWEADRACKAALVEHDSALLIMATGCGKTVTFAHLAHEWPWPPLEGAPPRVMVLAHRGELIHQAAEKLEAITGERPGIEMAGDAVDERSMLKPRIVVATVQTLTAGRLAKFRPDEFGLVIPDEAHHAVAPSYLRVLEHFAKAKVLGPTATPKRADEKAMGRVFATVAYEYGIERAIGDGYLVPVSQRPVEVEGLDFSKIKDVAGDFHEGELEAVLTQEGPLHKMAAPIVAEAKGRPALVFCCTVKHACLIAAVINRYAPGACEWLSGETSREERTQTVERYKRGELQMLANCGLFLEGFDAPATALVAMARPTKSLTLYTQVIGRGTRTLPGTIDGLDTPQARKAAIAASAKPNMIVLDFVGNAGRHEIVTAVDVLGGKYGSAVRAYAKKTVSEEKRPVGVDESLDRAEAELELLAEEAERRRKIKAEVSYRTREVSIFGARRGDVASAGPQAAAPRSDEITEAQFWYLVRRHGWDRAAAAKLGKRQASAIIAKCKDAERKKGAAS